ncbi:aldose epimerase family protein [Aliiglaciecola sp. NS0011-25]|uniref:aldose epimerase family protein n=1 Tax=Aliiglaciecola sp. NS0011-25 TaxID=3127654 RepID=UPI003106E0EF
MIDLASVLLSNSHGMTVEVINFGARITSIKFPVNGVATEMTLGYSSIQDYIGDEYYLGATCGRVCNRIAGAQFQLGKHLYQLTKNDGDNCLHGGVDNFAMRYWQIDEATLTQNSVTLHLHSAHDDQGFPGNLTVSVTYQLTAANALIIEYYATTDRPTPINLTNHCYFNLGESSGKSLYLQLMSSACLEADIDNIPTGNLLSLEEQGINFREPQSFGTREKLAQNTLLKHQPSFDHCFILDNTPFEQAKAVLTSVKQQVSLSVFTDQSAIQLYSGYYLAKQFSSGQGVCLEAQNYTDAENHQHFPSNVLRPNEQYQRKIIYQFASIN